MTWLRHWGDVIGACLVGAVALASPASADPADYGYEVEQVGKSSVKVRLVHKATGKLVTNAAFGDSTAVVGPRGKPATMVTKVKPVLDRKSGRYIVKTEAGMTVRELHLSASIDGEVGEIADTLTLGSAD